MYNAIDRNYGSTSMTVTARFDGLVFVPDGPVDLPIGGLVRVEFEPVPANPLIGLLADLAKLQANPDWPADGAAQHNHYLYGTPKAP